MVDVQLDRLRPRAGVLLLVRWRFPIAISGLVTGLSGSDVDPDSDLDDPLGGEVEGGGHVGGVA